MPSNGMIGKTIDHYRIDQMLGQGGMAAVYKAIDERLERPVAIKVMHPHLAAQKSFQNRFLQEARTAANLDHPNIVRILDFKPFESELFLVMEYITGGSLRQYIKRLNEESRFIDYPEAIEITRQLASALEFAHRRGMIHRDIKPDNVLLKPEQDAGRLNYRPILTDFGLAKLTSASEDAITDQQPIGTYPYMSPEQCLGDDIDTRSDIYSLGIMLYELSAGRLPYNPKTIAEAARMHGREPLPPPSSFQSNFPADLQEIIVKSLSKKAEDRFQTAAEMEKALLALQKPLQSPAQVRALPPRVTEEVAVVDPEFITDLTTALMTERLPAEPSFDVPPLQTDAGFDHLIFHSPNHPSFAAKLEKERTTIGRDAKLSDVVLEGTVISRLQAIVERKPNGRYTIAAPKTINPVRLDGVPLMADAPVIFNPGAIVAVGEYWMRLELKPILPEAVEEKLEDPDDIDLPMQSLDVPSFLDVGALDDSPPTKPLDAAFARDMPYYTPPHLTADQLGYDRLVFFSENAPTVIVRLDRNRIMIGRSQFDVVLSDPSVSRRHARVEKIGDEFYISDQGSSNGTWVDDERLPANSPTLLKPEQAIRIGNYWMRYEFKRDLPPELRPLSTAGAKLEVTDPNETAPMIKPLSMDLPNYSPPPLSPEMRTKDRLIFLSEDHPMQIIRFEGDILYVGRDEDLDIVLEGKRISRRHAMIERRNNRLYVTDLNSTNGTWVGDTLVVPDTEVPWKPDDNEYLRMGNYWVKFERADLEQYAAIVLQDNYKRVGKRIKNFRIDRFLGEGNISAVYKATEFPLERAVALRVMHPNLAMQEPLKQRFLQEARKLSQLNHENIARVFSFDNVDNELFMVMDLVTGPTLRAYLSRQRDVGKSISLNEIIGLSVQVADALHYAHQQGMMYRDMRPESIILKPVPIGSVITHKPILTEFGVARLSETGEIFATEKPESSFPYMSPEQCLGERIDIRSDVYELGVIVYEMLVGRPPYQPRSMSEAIRMHSRELLQLPSNFRSDIPEDLEKVIMKALEKRANDRFQTCAEFSIALQRTATFTEDAPDEFISGRMITGSDDPDQTAIMERPLPEEMPPPTRAPRPDDQREYDQLVLYSERFPTRVIVLNKNVYTIGREYDQDIVLAGDNVTRRHARLERAPGDVYRLIDYGSKNGTWLGGYRLIKNVAETWEKSETVRIGDFWLRIETPDDHIAPIFEKPEEAVEARPTIILPPPVTPMETEKIGVTVSNSILRVMPGQTTTLSVEVANRSDLVDHFRVEAVGLPPEWVTQPAQPLYLLPHNRDSTSLTFHPPLTSTSSAGGHAFEVRVTARAMGITSPGVQGALNVEPFYSFTTDLEPERIKRRGATEFVISNTSNSFMTFMLQARDREQGLMFDMAGQQYTLAPGQTDYVSIRVKSKRRPFLGRAITYPFEVKATPVPTEQAGGPQIQTGELIAPARFSILGLGCLLILLLLCGVLVGSAAFLQGFYFPAQTQTVTAIAMATGVPATATAAAGLDSDGDGLTNTQEIELKTRPDAADTDQDGLSDGEEVYIWKTDPLNRDTDGDNLSDGQETTRGTNPTNPDTDGDTIPDNVDSSPLAQPSPTITPFPTLEGSAGDICPGSPSPSRMAIGMDAIVTPGGVNNRLRDKPSVKDGKVIDLMPPTSAFTVIGGPECDADDQLRWWQVTFNGLTGWTAEGAGDEYYLGPPGAEGTASSGGGGGGSGGTSSIADPPELAAEVNPELVGVQLDINAAGHVMGLVQPLDVQWIKIQANWSALEPQGRGQLGGDFPRFQAALQEAKNMGYKVLVSVAKAPAWSRATNLGQDSPPDNPQDLADFLSRMLQQTGSNIDAIEVWNEPNLKREWNGVLPFTGAGYMTLFRPSYAAIRAISADIIIITAGLAPTGNSSVSVDDRDYLRQMYDAGLAQFGDVDVGIHPYGWGNAPDVRCCNTRIEGQGWANQPQFYFLDTIADYRAVMLAAGHNVHLWATEFGWATWEGFPGEAPEGWMTYNTPDIQADYTLAAFKIAQALDFMGPMFLWNLNFANPTTVNGGSDMAGYSLVYEDSGNTVVKRPLYDRMAGLR